MEKMIKGLSVRLVQWSIAGSLVISGWLPAAGSAAAPAEAFDLKAARRIYEEGVLLDGSPLVGKRLDGTVAVGRAAACSNCHRPSGMGMVEGDIQIAPITGRFLFPEAGEKPLATMDPRVGKRMNIRRAPHTDETLALAVRTGQGSNGQALGPLMPRFNLGDADMAALNRYLRQLSVQNSAGVEGRTIRFATVIAPGVEPARKKVMLDTLRTVFVQKNGSTVVGNHSRRHMVTAAELVLGTENKWTLDVWELTGPPETWGEQLRGYYKLAPPFALVSGLSNSTWEPVEQFCESEHVPCWFPSVAAAPVRAQPPQYSFYFSRGLPLEAEVLASQLNQGAKPAGRLVQVYRSDDASRAAVDTLLRAARRSQADAEPLAIDLGKWKPDEVAPRLQESLQGLRANDVVVLWLRPGDLRAVEASMAGVPARVFGSGTLISATSAFVPESLRKNMRLVYPYQLPNLRESNVAYMHIWLKLRRIPVVDESLQSEIYFAMNLLTDTLAEMLDNLYRDYMVERVENMIAQRESRKAEDEIRDQGLVRPRIKRVPMEAGIPQPAFGAGFAEHAAGLREGTTIYPRLSLGAGQRYASKGAYITRFDVSDPVAPRLIAETEWIVP